VRLANQLIKASSAGFLEVGPSVDLGADLWIGLEVEDAAAPAAVPVVPAVVRAVLPAAVAVVPAVVPVVPPEAVVSSALAVRAAQLAVSLAALAAIAEQTSLAAAPVVVDTEPQVCVAVAASLPAA